MADEPLNDTKRITPAARVEKKDAGTERIEPDTTTRDTKTAEDVKADASIEDRFEATDN
ncbi:MAG TPA: hypothetical protein VGJ78_06670 [Vicinamibacterales bacterium]|jgi:hypothetical protein